MRIAVPAENGQVAAHFGHCPQFVLADVDEDGHISLQTIANPGHRPGFLPRFLAEKDVEVLIAGGIGSSAIQIFDQLGVQVFTGAGGKVENVVERYVAGELTTTGVACRAHAHHDDECQQ